MSVKSEAQKCRHLAYQDHINPPLTVLTHLEDPNARVLNRAKASQRFLQKLRRNKLFQETKLKEAAVIPTSIELLHLKLVKNNIDLEKKRKELELQRTYITVNDANRIYNVDSPPQPNLCTNNLVRHVCCTTLHSPDMPLQFPAP